MRVALSTLDVFRPTVGAAALGFARRALDEALKRVRERKMFGAAMAELPLVQAKLADMALEIEKGMLLALHLGRLKDRGELQPHQISMGKLNNTRIAIGIAREARAMLGGNGITLDYSPMRHANNLESVRTYEGTDEVHTLVLGQAITGIAAFR
jgi:glutaryl-CoA dehydrogenase